LERGARPLVGVLDAFLRLGQVFGVHIAHRDGILQERAEIAVALATHPNEANPDEVGWVLSALGEGAIQKQIGQRQAGADTERCVAKKSTAGKSALTHGCVMRILAPAVNARSTGERS